MKSWRCQLLQLSRYQRNGQRAICDIKAIFGMAPPDPAQDLTLVMKMESLFEPLLGPTAAHKALLQEDDDDESSDYSMMDDDYDDAEEDDYDDDYDNDYDNDYNDDDMGSGDEA
jgi:hypothetical protein